MTPQEAARAVVDKIDELAREYDPYEYGLPMFVCRERFVAIVYDALRTAQAAVWRKVETKCKTRDAAYKEDGFSDTSSVRLELDRFGNWCRKQQAALTGEEGKDATR